MAAALWLLRHGEAEPRASSDAARDLTARGEEQARVAGRALAALGLVFDAVYTSPRVRAERTARLACASLATEPLVWEPLSGDFDGAGARALLAGHPDQRVLLVGHNPDFEQIVFDLTGARVEMKKAGVAGIRDGRLLVLLRPRELERIGA